MAGYEHDDRHHEVGASAGLAVLQKLEDFWKDAISSRRTWDALPDVPWDESHPEAHKRYGDVWVRCGNEVRVRGRVKLQSICCVSFARHADTGHGQLAMKNWQYTFPFMFESFCVVAGRNLLLLLNVKTNVHAQPLE